MTTPVALVEDLRTTVPVDSLSDLVNAKRSSRAAVPVLLDWLQMLDKVPITDRAKVRDMLVRSLSVPAARGAEGPLLVEEVRRTDDPSGLAYGEWLRTLCRWLPMTPWWMVWSSLLAIAPTGTRREMLMLALGQTKNPKAVEVLLELVDGTTVTDARGAVFGFVYDKADRLATGTDPLGVSDSYVYDPVGNLGSVIDRRGLVTRFTYDNLDRPTLVRFGVSGSTEESSITHTYDDGDRLTGLTDSESGTISFTYNGLDRLTSESTPLGTIAYTYDVAGRRITSTVSGQTTVDYTWDPSGLPTTITQGSSAVGYSYDAVGRVVTVSAPNNLTTGYVYDAASQLTSITHTQGTTTLGDLTYTYDSTGRVGHVGGSHAGVAIPSVLGTAVHDAANRITTWDGQAFTWDPVGNLTSDGTSTYTWNARGQLASVTEGTSTWTHSYDGTGRRIGIDDGTTLSQHLYDGPNPHLKYIDGNPTTTLLSGLGLDTHHARTASGTTLSYLTDRLGSTIGLANSMGTTANYAYTPFGQPVVAGDPGGNDFAFSGRPLDASGLHQLRARYYHPGLQRFISEDPLGLAAGPTNHYLYAANDPINHTDRTGLAADVLIDIGFIAYDAYQLFTGGRKNFASNLGALGFDILGALIPFATGLGAASKAATKADNIAGFADDAWDACRANSFAPGTLVLMADGGTKPIEDIEVGDWVWATDPETGEAGPRRVTDTISSDGFKHLVDIEINGATITGTDGHPFWVHGQDSWIDADDLEPGDLLLLADGSHADVDAVIERTSVLAVHNLTVHGIHTYHVMAGDDPVLVHNCSRVEDLIRMSEEWLGPNYRRITNDAGDTILVSQDAARRLRFDINRPYPHEFPHVHIDELTDNKWVTNRVWPRDVPAR